MGGQLARDQGGCGRVATIWRFLLQLATDQLVVASASASYGSISPVPSCPLRPDPQQYVVP